MPNETTEAPKAIRRLDKAAIALRMFRDGHSIQDIANTTGYRSKSGAWAAIHKALKLEVRPEVELMRNLELQRLDWLTQVLHKEIRDEGDKAKMRRARNIEVLLKVMERRAALLGMDLAEQRDVKRDGPAVVVLYERDPNQEKRRQEVADVIDGDDLLIPPRAALPAARLPDPGDGSQDPDDSAGGRDGLG